MCTESDSQLTKTGSSCLIHRLAESRSNPTLFETPVRRRDFFDDVNYLVATETTAKELMMSKSHEDLFSL